MMVIEAPHFYAALGVEDGVVVKAAPILHWAVGRSVEDVHAYCKKKRWKCYVRETC